MFVFSSVPGVGFLVLRNKKTIQFKSRIFTKISFNSERNCDWLWRGVLRKRLTTMIGCYFRQRVYRVPRVHRADGEEDAGAG
jgi:hypothetical protein